MLFRSGSCITLSLTGAATSSRLYDPSDIYIYNTPGKLLVSRDGGYTYTNIIPPGIGTVLTVGQTISFTTELTTTITHLMGVGGAGIVSRYQNSPEVSTWSTGSPPPSGLYPSDEATDYAGEIGILVGNNHSGTESRIVGAFTGAPFQFVDSDAGIPQSTGSMALITDLEICE